MPVNQHATIAQDWGRGKTVRHIKASRTNDPNFISIPIDGGYHHLLVVDKDAVDTIAV